jgi:hypothetical protein
MFWIKDLSKVLGQRLHFSRAQFVLLIRPYIPLLKSISQTISLLSGSNCSSPHAPQNIGLLKEAGIDWQRQKEKNTSFSYKK